MTAEKQKALSDTCSRAPRGNQKRHSGAKLQFRLFANMDSHIFPFLTPSLFPAAACPAEREEEDEEEEMVAGRAGRRNRRRKAAVAKEEEEEARGPIFCENGWLPRSGKVWRPG